VPSQEFPVFPVLEEMWHEAKLRILQTVSVFVLQISYSMDSIGNVPIPLNATTLKPGATAINPSSKRAGSAEYRNETKFLQSLEIENDV
jgi:hypothetical protein